MGVEFFIFFDKLLLDIFKVVIVFVIEYEELKSVVYLNDDEVWICGDDNIIIFYNI